MCYLLPLYSPESLLFTFRHGTHSCRCELPLYRVHNMNLQVSCSADDASHLTIQQLDTKARLQPHAIDVDNVK